MTDLSTDKPVITQWSEGWWAQARPEVAAHRCAAHRKNGDRCRRAALSGATVCDHHGANRSVRAKARQRLEDAADRMARELLGIATDKSASESVRLTAIRDALDRAGLRPPTEIAVSAGTKPYEDTSSTRSITARGQPGKTTNPRPRWQSRTCPRTESRSWTPRWWSPSLTAPTCRLGRAQSELTAPAEGHTRSVTSSAHERAESHRPIRPPPVAPR